MKELQLRILAPLALVGLMASPVAQAQATQGVTKNEIIIGSIQDLSGPIAGFGKQARNGLQMRVDEINQAGGVNGRRLRLVVEDSGYDPKRALLAAQKMVQQDRIFAMIGTIGTPVVMATLPILLERNVPNLFPLSAAREMYEPLHRLKFSMAAPYYDQARSGVQFMAKERGAKSFCVIYQDDEFGLEVMRGAEEGLKKMGMNFTERTTYKRGATDFSSQVARMRGSGCDTIVMGTIIRETIGTIGEARKMGWNPNFLGTSASYTELIHKLGGKAMDGFYSTFQVAVPYLDDPSKNVRDWGAAYKARFNEDPSVFTAYGYSMITMFVQAAEKAGPNLTVDSLVSALETTEFPRDMFGSPPYRFSKTNRLGNERSRVGQIQNGKWVAVTDYLDY
jgi:branched-chain amino acid transport system substrate-binding protein